MLIIAFLAIAVVVAFIYVRAAGAMMWKGVLMFAGCFVALNLLVGLMAQPMVTAITNGLMLFE